MMNIKQILCPTDLTTDSSEALRYAVALAHTYDSKLLLCHCGKEPALASQSFSPGEHGASRSLFADTLYKHLDKVDLAKLDWEGIIVEDKTDPAEGIAREAAKRGVDLIVMRSRRRPRAAILLGSTAEAICRTAPCPVLVTHPQEREWVDAGTGEVELRRVLIAYDFSDDSERALAHALYFAQEYQSELHLLHVLPKPYENGPEIAWGPSSVESAYHNAARRLQEAVPKEANLWCKITSAVRWGKPYKEILSYSAEQNIDMICMGVSGAGFMMESLFGSNVDRVLRQAPCPVLAARPLKPSPTFVTA